ncbi:MAG: single-stranded-DNA-specific exonuclease RecJ, partial [Clostridia bacterium]|nr:single-stranded-DNA-specific exonuclease RecJ [Clostridia bacterium]
MIISRKIFTEEQLNIISSLSESCNITNTTAKILYSRGYVTKEDINGFLYPDRSLFHNPYDLKNLDLAVERIKCAKENGETVVVFGDYDADGICATTILCKALRIFGVEVIPVIPERENGYGLTEESIELVLNEYFPDLIITVDCGISSYNEIEYLKDLGVDVIVTDHHEIPETVPDCIAVNCKFKDQNYPFDCLSGAGVAYKLASALIGDRANMFLDLVTVATVADNMPLIDENRLIVKEGIELIKKGLSNKPLKSIISLSGIKEITSSSIAYGIVPRVNASGRMGDAHTALKLFLSENDDEIFELSNKLLIYNNERKSEGDGLYLEAKAKLPKGNYGNVIVLHNENWNTGLVGIISAKIAEEYNLPALLFTKSGEYYHGSARSIDSVNIYECILECKELLKGFGGHSQAAGVTIDESNLESFAIKLNEVIKNKYTFNDFERKIEIDEVIEKAPSKKFLNELALLEPFGIGNKEPVFLKTVESVESKIFKNLHLSFKDSGMDFIYFNGIRDHTVLSLDCKKYLIVEPSLSVYNGK